MFVCSARGLEEWFAYFFKSPCAIIYISYLSFCVLVILFLRVFYFLLNIVHILIVSDHNYMRFSLAESCLYTFVSFVCSYLTFHFLGSLLEQPRWECLFCPSRPLCNAFTLVFTPFWQNSCERAVQRWDDELETYCLIFSGRFLVFFLTSASTDMKTAWSIEGAGRI